MVVRQRAAAAALPTLMRALRRETPSKHPSSLLSLRRAFSLYDQINLTDNVPDDQLGFQEYFVSRHQTCIPYPSLKLSGQYQILILECGSIFIMRLPNFVAFIRSTGMKMEVLDSRNAASTYNILNEGRIVAAAFIPYGVVP